MRHTPYQKPGQAGMNGLTPWLGAAALLLALALAAPARAQQPAAAEVAELLALSGTDALLEQMPGLVTAQVESRRQDLPATVFARLERAMGAAFHPAALKLDAKAALAERYDRARFSTGLAWLRSPAGRRMAQLEMDARRDENQDALGAWVETMQQHAPSRDRLILVGDVLRESGTVSTVIEMIVLVAEPVLRTLNALAGEGQGRTPDELVVLLNAMRRQLENPIGKQMLLRGLYTYRDVSDAELGAYRAFLTSEAGQDLYEALNASTLDALRKGGARYAGALASVTAP